MPELSEEKVEQLVGGIQTATASMKEAQTKMDENTQKYEALCKQLDEAKKDAGTNGNRIDALTEKIETLSAQMHDTAEKYTDTINNLRQSMKALGNDGGDETKAFVARNGKGSIFNSRQEALEIGYYLMATMKPQNDARQYARRWLKEHAQDLRYLPNIPQSFVTEMGEKWLEQQQQQQYNGMNLKPGSIGQDLAGGTTPGSILTRPVFADTLIRNVEEHGVFRRDALIWPMGSDRVMIPRRKAGVAVRWEGEAETGSGTDPTFDMLEMIAKKYFMLHKYSSELSEDAAISLADIFMFEFALAVALEEDRIGFNGDGSGGNSTGFAGFTGVLGADGSGTEATAETNKVPHLVTGAAGNNLTSEITYAKLREMSGKLPTWADNGAKWYAHKSVHADIDGVETTGGNLVAQIGQATGMAPLLGYPREKVDQMPTAASITAGERPLALGNLRKGWVLGDRRRPEVQTSEHFAFDTDQITIRTTGRISFKMIHGDAFVIYVTGTA